MIVYFTIIMLIILAKSLFIIESEEIKGRDIYVRK